VAKCPTCRTDVTKISKKWKYGHFSVEAYLCAKCGTKFREYYGGKSGKYSFTLKHEEGKRYRKV
jgi:DNA-directed RNA polymerase subunit RPC12/RpoP